MNTEEGPVMTRLAEKQKSVVSTGKWEPRAGLEATPSSNRPTSSPEKSPSTSRSRESSDLTAKPGQGAERATAKEAESPSVSTARKLAADLAQWAAKAAFDVEKAEPAPEVLLDDLVDVLGRALLRQDEKVLAAVEENLAPAGYVLGRALLMARYPRAVVQAAETGMLAALTSYSKTCLERSSPERTLDGILHGRAALAALQQLGGGRLSLGDILNEMKRATGENLSESTVSRALSALDHAGFIAKHGRTSGVRYVLSPWGRILAPEVLEKETQAPAAPQDATPGARGQMSAGQDGSSNQSAKPAQNVVIDPVTSAEEPFQIIYQ